MTTTRLPLVRVSAACPGLVPPDDHRKNDGPCSLLP